MNWREWLQESARKLQENEQRRRLQTRKEKLRQSFWAKARKLNEFLQQRQGRGSSLERKLDNGTKEPLAHLALEPLPRGSQGSCPLNAMLCLVSHSLPREGHVDPATRPLQRSRSEVTLTTGDQRHLVALMDLVIELAYPRSAICRLCDRDKRANADTMSRLISGGSSWYDWGSILIAGSQAEGLALETNWGHPPADLDSMWLLGDQLSVQVPDGTQSHASGCFVYRPEGCPRAYCRLEVTDDRPIRQAFSKHRHSCWERRVPLLHTPRCIQYEGGRRWLNTYHSVRVMKGRRTSIVGPAGQFGLHQWVMTLVGSGSYPDIEREFSQRPRGSWPPEKLIQDIQHWPMLIVLVGHKYSKGFKRQARLSWSHCEMKIVLGLPDVVKQGYIACKYVLKHFLTMYRGHARKSDGRSCISSYHIKTTFLYFLEKCPPHSISSPFELFIGLLYDLDNYLKVGHFPHYFLARCDLLETVGNQERAAAHQVIQAILSDPLAALLTSPSSPQQIYGEVRPGAIVSSFQRFTTHPACSQSRKDITNLLRRLDNHRREHFREQQAWDKGRISRRPLLIKLAAMLL